MPMARQKRLHKCPLCIKFFVTEHSRSQHADSVHGTFKCDSCPERFHSLALHREHSRSAHRFPCGLCGKTFPAREARLQHENAAHMPPGCEPCNRTFKTKDARERHMEAKHGGIRCPWWGERCESGRFATAGEVEGHIVEKHQHLGLCWVCHRTFPDYLVRHIERSHRNGISCSLCPRRFQTDEMRRRHVDMDHIAALFCNACGKATVKVPYGMRNDDIVEETVNRHLQSCMGPGEYRLDEDCDEYISTYYSRCEFVPEKAKEYLRSICTAESHERKHKQKHYRHYQEETVRADAAHDETPSPSCFPPALLRCGERSCRKGFKTKRALAMHVRSGACSSARVKANRELSERLQIIKALIDGEQIDRVAERNWSMGDGDNDVEDVTARLPDWTGVGDVHHAATIQTMDLHTQEPQKEEAGFSLLDWELAENTPADFDFVASPEGW